jgi:hypothetical protein
MNYFQTLKDSLHIFRTTRPIWFLGLLSCLSLLFSPIAQYARNNLALSCIWLLLAPVASVISFMAICGIIYSVQQVTLCKQSTFPEAWSKARSKLFRIIGLLFLSIPFILIEVFVSLNILSRPIPSPFSWILDFLGGCLYSAFLIFGYCAIIINDTKSWSAAWASVLITLNNLLRVLVIEGAFYLVSLCITVVIAVILATASINTGLPTPLTFEYATYQRLTAIPIIFGVNFLFALFLTPLNTIFLTLGFAKFTKDVSYPSLSSKETTV